MKNLTVLALLFTSLNVFAGMHEFRVKSKIDLVKANANYGFRRFYGVKIVDRDEPNAYAIGTHIVVTKQMLNLLNDRELTAVVAHEMAHRERYHLFSRMGMTVGGMLAALLDWNNPDDLLDRFGKFSEHFQLDQELEADCYAYHWLNDLKRKGIAVEPLDLNKATEKIFGIDFTNADPEYYRELAPFIRVHAVIRGMPRNCRQ